MHHYLKGCFGNTDYYIIKGLEKIVYRIKNVYKSQDIR